VCAEATVTSGNIDAKDLISISQSSSRNESSGLVAGSVIGGLILFALLVGLAILYKRHHQRLRKQDTQQFAMQKGLVGAKSTGGKVATVCDRLFILAM
jgi:hypothetical protein